jgi:hypothetical protein
VNFFFVSFVLVVGLIIDSATYKIENNITSHGNKFVDVPTMMIGSISEVISHVEDVEQPTLKLKDLIYYFR